VRVPAALDQTERAGADPQPLTSSVRRGTGTVQSCVSTVLAVLARRDDTQLGARDLHLGPGAICIAARLHLHQITMRVLLARSRPAVSLN
jgi:hypothetical protein